MSGSHSAGIAAGQIGQRRIGQGAFLLARAVGIADHRAQPSLRQRDAGGRQPLARRRHHGIAVDVEFRRQLAHRRQRLARQQLLRLHQRAHSPRSGQRSFPCIFISSQDNRTDWLAILPDRKVRCRRMAIDGCGKMRTPLPPGLSLPEFDQRAARMPTACRDSVGELLRLRLLYPPPALSMLSQDLHCTLECSPSGYWTQSIPTLALPSRNGKAKS